MKGSRSICSIAVLILGSLFFNATQTYAVNTSESNVNATIEIQNNNRKKLRQEKRKIKNLKRPKKELSRKMLIFLISLLSILTGFFIFLFGILLLLLATIGAGSFIVLGVIIFLGLSIFGAWGISKMVKAIKKRPRIKESL